MTHSLHRKGTENDLTEDYIMLAMFASGINDNYDDSRQKLIRVGEIMDRHNPVNIMPEMGWRVSPILTAAFDNIESVKNVIRQLKKEDLGISIVISGLISELENALKEVDLDIHTVHFSLGTFGKKELLPSEKILEITTMCGHHCISPTSVSTLARQVALKKISISKAIKKLSKPCVCGIFNTSRAMKILNTMVKGEL